MRAKEGMEMKSSRERQSGFTLTELAIATAVLLFGVVAVMQLVPFAMKTNTANRTDTTAVVIAQHMLDEMASQSFNSATVTDPVCGVMSLGAGAIGASVMSPNATYVAPYNGSAALDFTKAAAAGYNCNYADPNNAASAVYQVRWGVVVTESAGGQVVSKRFIVGVKRTGMQFRYPVNVETTVQR